MVKELDLIITGSNPFSFIKIKPSLKAYNLATKLVVVPKPLLEATIHLPWQSLTLVKQLVGPGLPLVAPSIFSLKKPLRGFSH